jgi:hypothetical protein
VRVDLFEREDALARRCSRRQVADGRQVNGLNSGPRPALSNGKSSHLKQLDAFAHRARERIELVPPRAMFAPCEQI